MICRGVTSKCATFSSRPWTLPLGSCFQISTPPGLTIFGVKPLAAPNNQAMNDRRRLRLLALDRLHDEMVVAHEDEEPLVDAGRVFELFMDVARGQRRDRGVEGGGVAHARRTCSRWRTCSGRCPSFRCVCSACGRPFRPCACLLGPHLAGGVHLGSGDVTVHVDAAGHDDQAGGVERPVRPDLGIRRRVDDLPVTNPDIAALAVDAVNRVVDSAPRNLEEPAAHRSAESGGAIASAPVTRRWIAESTSKSLGWGEGNAGRRKIGTSSMR